MISETMCCAICDQLNREFNNANLYLTIAIDCEQAGWFGAQHYFMKQFEEEQGHAFKMIEYLQDQQMRPVIAPLPVEQSEWPDFKSVFEASLAREKRTTQEIKNILSIAQNEQDYASHEFFEWFIKEQVDEERQFYDILRQIALANGDTAALFEIDEQLGER